MDFNLTPEQKELQAMFREFTDKEIRPRAQEMDETCELNEELWQMMAEMGCFGMVTPEEYGGVGLDFTSLVLLMEEAVKGAGTVYNWIAVQNGLNTSAILKYGTEEQKRKYVPAAATGEVKVAFALTEPGAGTDAASLTTKAELVGDKFIINGTKTFCTMASLADRILTTCRVIENGEDKGFATIIVPGPVHGTPGLTTNEEHKMGLRGTPLNEVSYVDVEVPVENLLGEIGQGMEISICGLNEIRTGCAGFAVGLAQEAINQAVKYSTERMQFGKRISQFQNTQFVLAECQTKVDAARLLAYRAAAGLDAGSEDRTFPAMAKYYAGEVCNDVVRKCLQVFGGYGYMKDYPIERIYRDAKIAEIFDGTAEVQKILISKAMGVR